MRRVLWVLAAMCVPFLAGCACVGNLANSVHSKLYHLTHPFSAGACFPGGGAVPGAAEPAPLAPPEVYEGNGAPSPSPAPLPGQ